MHELDIEGFPDAGYNAKTGVGRLCYYFPYGLTAGDPPAMEKSVWRSKSYSPEILNFKEKKPGAIEFFLKPFGELLDYVVDGMGRTRSYLVPAPSSAASHDPIFNRGRKVGQGRNCDIRNLLFCRALSQDAPETRSCMDLVKRSKSIESKSHSLELQMESLELERPAVRLDRKRAFIVVDDVTSSGKTLDAIRSILISRGGADETQVACLVIGEASDREWDLLPDGHDKYSPRRPSGWW